MFRIFSMIFVCLLAIVGANNFSDSRCRCLCPPLTQISDEAKVYFGSDAAEANTCTSEKVVRPEIEGDKVR